MLSPAFKLSLAALLLTFSFSACQTASLQQVQVTPTPTPTTVDDNINRPVSEPYTGDLSIFEDAERAKNLQIERVMDILKIQAGKNVADIGAGSGLVHGAGGTAKVGAKGRVFAVEINQ